LILPKIIVLEARRPAPHDRPNPPLPLPLPRASCALHGFRLDHRNHRWPV